MTEAWLKRVSASIRRGLRAKYGAGWRHLSETQRDDATKAAVLDVLVHQDKEGRHGPAIAMVDGPLSALEVS